MQPLFFVKRGAFVNNLGEEIKDWIVSIVIAVVLAMIIRNFLAILLLLQQRFPSR